MIEEIIAFLKKWWQELIDFLTNFFN